jgi:hypothetical protein
MSEAVPNILRVARPSDDLDALMPFYSGGLGFEVLLRFENHDGFDGLVLGHSSWPYHLEFTRLRDHPAGRAPSRDHLLVFYHPDPVAWRRAVARMNAAGFEAVSSFNPYWSRFGETFEDPDGYRVVLQKEAWRL